MNEFTKKELQYLFTTFLLTNSDKFEHELEEKIKSLIDNHCNHEFVTACGSCISIECKHCGTHSHAELIK